MITSTITVLDGIPLNPGDVDWKPLESLGSLRIFDNHDPARLAERVRESDIILTNKAPIRAKDIAALKGVRLVGVLATGINVVDAEALKNAGIAVCNVPAYGVEDVAQHALALIMELARATTLHSEGVKKGEWQASGWCYWKKAPLSLCGLTLGIIGFGAIGQMLGRYASALGMNILAYSPGKRASVDYPFTFCEMDELFRSSDIISLHCPLNPATENLINSGSIAQMKKGAILINTARGRLVDEQAVAKALASGRLGGMGTDVLAIEPPTSPSPLYEAPNTIITPHMAWATTRARQNIINIMAENIRAFLSGKPANLVN